MFLHVLPPLSDVNISSSSSSLTLFCSKQMRNAYTVINNISPAAIVTRPISAGYLRLYINANKKLSYRQQVFSVFVCQSVCLSVGLLARLLKNACMDLDEMLRVDRCRDTDELTNV